MWMALWYFAIAAGFFLLGLRYWLVTRTFSFSVGLRWAVALGFLVLGVIMLQFRQRR